MRLSAILLRCGHLRAVSGLGFWLRWAGMMLLVYVRGMGMSLSSFKTRTTRPVIFWLVIVSSARTVESLRLISGPLTPSFSNVLCFIKQASDWSSSKAYTITFLLGESWWWSHTGTIRECVVPSTWPFALQISMQWAIRFWLFVLLISCLPSKNFWASSWREVGWHHELVSKSVSQDLLSLVIGFCTA